MASRPAEVPLSDKIAAGSILDSAEMRQAQGEVIHSSNLQLLTK